MSHKSMTISEFVNEEPCCKPLDTYEEILAFLEEPPAWRSLCQEMTPHSKDKIRNINLSSMVGEIAPDRPPTFCHFSPDQEDVEREPASSLPKTLVCHDMANGYHDDSKIDGTSNHTAYTFYHWGGIDIFCYFSHHLVTIPPVGWINVGHAHGVKVIGTVITEWTEGIDFWDFVLEEPARYEQLASALVTIAHTLKFDGWLLNVENKVSKPLVLLEFVQLLHRRLHEAIADAELIWYDSVTIKGNLNWQNGLNDSNKDFFEACDGFFTNYSWKEEDVAGSAEAAGARLRDLYVGIDVWGRNFYGGGQFNTAAAVELASGYGCSLAIFAPAWTHEAGARRDADVALADELDAPGLLRLRERALWGSLWAYLATRLPARLPFQTSFCRGHGTKRRLYGEVMSPGPWYNLRHMQYQPNSSYGPHGYLLSTPELIAEISHQAIIRDKTKGIIKYHSSFEESRHELHRVRSMRELHELQRDHHDSLVAVQGAPPAPAAAPAAPPDAPPDARRDSDDSDDSRRHSMKNTFKHMFRLKSRRRSQEPAAAAAAAAAAAHSQHELRAGWSMRQLSLNINLGQHRAPPRLALACVLGEQQCLEPYFDDSYTGGSCLRVHPSDALSPEHRWTRLFHCDFPCESELIVCVVTKTVPGYPNQYLDVKLFARDARGQETRVSCIGRAVPGGGAGGAGGVAAAAGRLAAQRALTAYPLPAGPARDHLQRFLLLRRPGFYQSVENSFGWRVRYYVVPLGRARVTSVNVHCGHSEGPVLLGHFGLCHRYEDEEDLYDYIPEERPRVARDLDNSALADTTDPPGCTSCAANLLSPAGGVDAFRPSRDRTATDDDPARDRGQADGPERDRDVADDPERERYAADVSSLDGKASDDPMQDRGVADDSTRDAAVLASSRELGALCRGNTRTVATDLPRIHRAAKKVQYEGLPEEPPADREQPSQDRGTSPLRSSENAEATSTLTGSKVSLTKRKSLMHLGQNDVRGSKSEVSGDLRHSGRCRSPLGVTSVEDSRAAATPSPFRADRAPHDAEAASAGRSNH